MSSVVSFATKPTLEGHLVVLRPVQAAEAAGLVEMDEEALQLTGTHQTHSLEALDEWHRSRADHEDRLDVSIIERATGEWAGEVVLNDLKRGNRSSGFRILLVGPNYFGRGLGTEAAAPVLSHTFESVGVHRIKLDVYAFDPRARHL